MSNSPLLQTVHMTLRAWSVLLQKEAGKAEHDHVAGL